MRNIILKFFIFFLCRGGVCILCVWKFVIVWLIEYSNNEGGLGFRFRVYEIGNFYILYFVMFFLGILSYCVRSFFMLKLLC